MWSRRLELGNGNLDLRSFSGSRNTQDNMGRDIKLFVLLDQRKNGEATTRVELNLRGALENASWAGGKG